VSETGEQMKPLVCYYPRMNMNKWNEICIPAYGDGSALQW